MNSMDTDGFNQEPKLTTDTPQPMPRLGTLYDGTAGVVSYNEVRLFGFHARDRFLVALRPGLASEPSPLAEHLQFGQWKPWPVVLSVLGLSLLLGWLHWPGWLIFLVAFLVVVMVVFWPLLREYLKVVRWVWQKDVITLFIGQSGSLEQLEVGPETPPLNWVGEQAVVTVRGLSFLDRLKLVLRFFWRSVLVVDRGGAS